MFSSFSRIHTDWTTRFLSDDKLIAKSSYRLCTHSLNQSNATYHTYTLKAFYLNKYWHIEFFYDKFSIKLGDQYQASILACVCPVCLSRGEKGGPLGGGVGVLIRSIIRLWQSHQPICSAGYWFISIKKFLKSISPCCCQFTKVEARYKETIQSERGKKNLL